MQRVIVVKFTLEKRRSSRGKLYDPLESLRITERFQSTRTNFAFWPAIDWNILLRL